jgi:hypothetical protein
MLEEIERQRARSEEEDPNPDRPVRHPVDLLVSFAITHWTIVLWTLTCLRNDMSPVDKTPENKKETAEEEADLRHEWEEEDIEDEGRKPDLGEIEKDDLSL